MPTYEGWSLCLSRSPGTHFSKRSHKFSTRIDWRDRRCYQHLPAPNPLTGTSREGLAVDATREEEWRPIPSTNGVYEASSLGNIRSTSRYVSAGRGQTLRPGQPIKTQLLKTGYRQVRIVFPDGQRTVRVHRLICEAFHGNSEPGQEVRHLNGINYDNRPENLRWGTRKENVADSVEHGSIRNGRRERTHCPQGHRLLEPNLRLGAVLDRGHRVCRSCEYGRTYARANPSLDARETADRLYQERFRPREDEAA